MDADVTTLVLFIIMGLFVWGIYAMFKRHMKFKQFQMSDELKREVPENAIDVTVIDDNRIIYRECSGWMCLYLDSDNQVQKQYIF